MSQVPEAYLSPKAESRLSALVQRLVDGNKNHDTFGTFTPVCYDTAWVAMITKEVDGEARLLFPRCFSYLIQNQAASGGWGETLWPIDAILNSLAALLCLVHHRDNKITSNISTTELNDRISKAQTFIASSLQQWDVDTTVHVGFEILIPSLLRYLSEHAIEFDFPGRNRLMELNAKKLAKFDARFLYSKQTTTLVHSLEAFIGEVDFNKVKHHLRDGSMLGSPSATAVYLMHAQPWDEAAEEYLKRVSSHSLEEGGIPSAFPSPIFESSWAISAFLASGVDRATLRRMGARGVVEHVTDTLSAQNGTVGFASGMLADADDTAKCLQMLAHTSRTVSPEAMISAFSSADCFRTFSLETSPSFSANCNVLLALLAQKDLSPHMADISRAASFLLDAWDSGPVSDKWNMSPIYSSMLFSQIITSLLTKADHGVLDAWMDNVVQHRLAIIIMDIVNRLLPIQEINGSWGGCAESTAYGVLTIANILKLPLDPQVQDIMSQALIKGRSYLQINEDSWDHPEYLWVEKVSYGSPVLSEAYCLAAMIVPTSQLSWTERTRSLFTMPQSFSKKLSGLCQMLPLTSKKSPEELRCVIVQSYYYLQRLQGAVPRLFPEFKMSENKYLPIVPFTWIISNHVHGGSLSNKVIWEMMRFSVLMFQADEYMESSTADLSNEGLNILENVIRQRCGCSDTWVRSSHQYKDKYQCAAKDDDIMSMLSGTESTSSQQSDSSGNKQLKTLRFGAIAQVLDEVISHILDKSTLSKADAALQQYVSHELCGFLLAHIHHIRDNTLFSEQNNLIEDSIKCFTNPGITYHDWVHCVAADDTSCPFAFSYFCGLLSKDGQHPLADVEAQYLAKSLCRHLAVMCRQYNDYGSLTRDLEEGNLNGLNFPEFSAEVKRSKENAKHKMMKLAEFERKCLNLALEELNTVADKSTVDAIATFIDVTDLYGQLYLIKDLAKRVK